MLDALITSKTRIKLLLKFFLNSSKKDYLRNLEAEFGDNNNAIRQELNRLEEAGLLVSTLEGNKKYFQSNSEHPLFLNIHHIVLKVTGLDEIISEVLNNVGDLQEVYLTGDLAQGRDTELIDLIMVGDVNREYVSSLVNKAEKIIKKNIRFVCIDTDEFALKKDKLLQGNDLLLWEK
jgi:hypothetical protein